MFRVTGYILYRLYHSRKTLQQPVIAVLCNSTCSLNPLTTNDDYRRYRNSAACYQLAQSVLKIGSALAERVGQGEVGGCHPEGDSAWYMVAVAAGCRKALVNARWAILLSCTNP